MCLSLSALCDAQLTLEALRATTESGEGLLNAASRAPVLVDAAGEGAESTPGKPSSSSSSSTLWGQVAQSADVYGHIQEATRKGVEAAVAVMRSPARHEIPPSQPQAAGSSSSLWALAADTESQVRLAAAAAVENAVVLLQDHASAAGLSATATAATATLSATADLSKRAGEAGAPNAVVRTQVARFFVCA